MPANGLSRGVTRRGFLSASGLLVSGSTLFGTPRLESQGTSPAVSPLRTRTRIIDIHHHHLPPAYLKVMSRFISSGAASSAWTPQMSLDKMDRDGIATAVMSIAGRGVAAPDGNAATTMRLAREVNEYAARMAVDYPGRFGLFASLPLPAVDASLAELTYAYDTLHADGVALLSHYDQATYLGDPKLAPVLEELNRRAGVVFIHPSSPFYSAPPGSAIGDNPISNVGLSSPEFPFETARAIVSLHAAQAHVRYPRVKFIVAHGGGVALSLISRIAHSECCTVSRPSRRELTIKQAEDDIRAFLRTLYYDFTLAFAPESIKAIVGMAPTSHLLCGSDFPNVRRKDAEIMEAMIGNLRDGLTAEQFTSAERRNAEALFPRFRS